MIQIQWTAPNLEEARKIARILLERKLVACANLLPNVESIYVWEGKIEVSHEVKVLLKTKSTLFEKVRDVILEYCSYKVPEIASIEMNHVHTDYQQWLVDNTL
jgi:periplasmic divalent cation tolerance protein